MGGTAKTGRASFGVDRKMIVTSLVLAYGVGLWTQLVHWRAGGSAADGADFVPRWLRDSTLSLSLILLAGLVAVMIADRRHATGLHRAAMVGGGAAVAMALGVPFHGGLFGHAAHVHTHSLPLAMLTEFVLDLPVAIGLASAAHLA